MVDMTALQDETALRGPTWLEDAIGPKVLFPALAGRCLYGNSLCARTQYLRPISRILTIKKFKAGHAYHAGANACSVQKVAGIVGNGHFPYF